MFDKSFGDATGPLGFPMHSNDAKELEGILKTLPSEVKDVGLQHMTCLAKTQTISEEEHTDTSIITTSMLDRDREVVIAEGIDWKQFKKNPIVTFAHMYDCLPVGRCLWVKAEKFKGANGWIAKTRYTPRPGADIWPVTEAWFPDAVFHFIKCEDLRGKSIGFIPLSIRPPTDKELKMPEMANCRCIFDKVLALEYAVAPVQANPDALVQTVSKCRKNGIKVPDVLLSALGMVVPEGFEEGIEPPKEKSITHIRFSSLRESVLKKVEGALSSLNIEEIVNGVVNKKLGKL